MRTVGMGAMPKSEEDKKLFSENAALRQENEELKAKKASKKGKTDSAADVPATE